MRIRLLSALAMLVVAPAIGASPPIDPSTEPGVNECVIMLHGLARKSMSMRKLAKSLARAGYRVHNHGYPSRKATVGDLAAEVIPVSVARCRRSAEIPVHFVTHSMGGILLRHYLDNHRLEGLGRTVMLSPPNRGSELVDKLRWVPGFRLINGPAGRELGTNHSAVTRQLGPAYFEVGVIAGNRSFNPLYSLMIPGDDDGKVSVAHARLDGMTDFLIVPHSHTWIMNSDLVIEQVQHFLAMGRFDTRESRATTL